MDTAPNNTAPVNQPVSTPPITPVNPVSNGTSNDTRTIVTALLLLFLYPIGLIVMWSWTKWPLWLKILLSLPILLFVVAILFGLVLIAINPSSQFATANNTQRMADITSIDQALSEYIADNKGKLPSQIPSNAQNLEISKSGADICSDIVTTYLPSLPVDPSIAEKNITDCNSNYDTGFTITVGTNNKITIYAPHAELGKKILYPL